jgi:hypothetical protein
VKKVGSSIVSRIAVWLRDKRAPLAGIGSAGMIVLTEAADQIATATR